MTAFPKADVQDRRIGRKLMSAYGRKQPFVVRYSETVDWSRMGPGHGYPG